MHTRIKTIISSIDSATTEEKADFAALIKTVLDNAGKPTLTPAINRQLTDLQTKHNPDAYKLIVNAAMQCFEAVIQEHKTRAGVRQ